MSTIVHVLEAFVVPLIVSIATSTYIASRGQIARTDRIAANLNKDLFRWMRDRDREARTGMELLQERANAMGAINGGAVAAGAGKVYTSVLHQYRDQLSSKARELEDQLAGELRVQRWWRRWRRTPVPHLKLDPEAQRILDAWRLMADEDVSRAELEPRLALVEQPG